MKRDINVVEHDIYPISMFFKKRTIIDVNEKKIFSLLWVY